MKVLITTGIFPPASGGPATYAPKLAEGLAAVGHQVKIITLSDRSDYPKDDQYDFQVVRIKRRFKLFNYLRFFWVVLREMKAADVAYTLSFFSLGFLTSLAARLRDVPYVVRVGGDYLWEHFYLHNNPPLSLLEFYQQKLHKKYPLGFRIIKALLGKAETVVFNSKVQAGIYREHYNLPKDKVTVVYNPAPEEESAVQREEANQEIVYAGRLVPMKNVDTLIRAFRASGLPDYTLVIIGDGPQRDELVDLVADLELEEQVEFLGDLSQKQLFERITASRLVVLPSWTDISPHFAFECLSLELPLLITRENFLPFRSQLPNTIDPGSADDIAEKIRLLTRNEEAYRRHKEALQKITFEWSWNDIVTAHNDLFKKIA